LIAAAALVLAQLVPPFPTPPHARGSHERDPVVPAFLEDVARGQHTAQTVQVRGTFQRFADDTRYWELGDGVSRILVIVRNEMIAEAPRLVGHRVQAVGYVRELKTQGTCLYLGKWVPDSFCLDPDLPPTPDPQPGWPPYSVTVWKVWDDPEAAPHAAGEGSQLGNALAAADAGSDIVLAGRFCGIALCGPAPGPRPRPDAWLLKDGEDVVWIFGKEPKGGGWRLDASYPGDSRRWLEVAGRLDRCEPVPCVRARKVTLAAPPPDARASPGP
jgi:hypothetical protein